MEAPLRTAPIVGHEYFVEADVSGIESVANIRFELVDEMGRKFQTLNLWKAADGVTDGEFHGFITVPNKAFRSIITGTKTNGAEFRSVLSTLFHPAPNGPPDDDILPAGTPTEYASRIRALVADYRQQILARAAQAVVDHPGGVISIQRMIVSKIGYEPLALPSGSPIGLRLRYSIQFSSRQTIRATPHIFPVYRPAAWRGMVTMKSIGGSVSPAPTLPGATSLNDVIVYQGAATYDAGVTYNFVIDMVPDFVIRGSQTGRFCIYEQKFTNRQAWDALIAADTPVPYSVAISETGTSATIPTFFPQRTFYESFAAAGAFDCGAAPNVNF